MRARLIAPLHVCAVVVIFLICGSATAQVQALLPGRSTQKERTRNLGERIGELLQKKDYAEARKILEETLGINPGDLNAKTLLAAVLIYEKKYDEAEQIYSELQQIDPENIGLFWNSAEIDFLRGRYAAAREKLQKLLEKKPNDEIITYKLGLTYLMEGLTEQAEVEIEKIRFPSDTAAYYYGRAALALKAGRREEGLKWTAEAARIFPYSHNALFADSLIEKGLMTADDVAATGMEADTSSPEPAPAIIDSPPAPGLLGAPLSPDVRNATAPSGS